MNYLISLLGLIVIITPISVYGQQDVCSEARDCNKVGFVYAFTTDTNADAIDPDDADRIKADVRKCFMPCAESARKIAKIKVAAGDPLFDKSINKKESSGRGRGRIQNAQADNPWLKGSSAIRAQANAKVQLAQRRLGIATTGGRKKRQTDDGSCARRILGTSPFEYLTQCEAKSAGSSPSSATTSRPSVKETTTLSAAASFRARFLASRGGARGSGRGKRQARGKFNAKADAKGELLYMFAYSKDIATRLCPDQRNAILACVQKATKGRVNLDRINPETVKQRYCKVEAECQAKKSNCIRERGQEEQARCGCVNDMKSKIGSRCELPPSPCDAKFQADPPRRDTSGDVCQAAVPTSEEIIQALRNKHGAGDYEEKVNNRKAKAKLNSNTRTSVNTSGRRTQVNTSSNTRVNAGSSSVNANTNTNGNAQLPDRISSLFNRFSQGRG